MCSTCEMKQAQAVMRFETGLSNRKRCCKASQHWLCLAANSEYLRMRFTGLRLLSFWPCLVVPFSLSTSSHFFCSSVSCSSTGRLQIVTPCSWWSVRCLDQARKEKEKPMPFRRQTNEKPSNIPGCPSSIRQRQAASANADFCCSLCMHHK